MLVLNNGSNIPVTLCVLGVAQAVKAGKIPYMAHTFVYSRNFWNVSVRISQFF